MFRFKRSRGFWLFTCGTLSLAVYLAFLYDPSFEAVWLPSSTRAQGVHVTHEQLIVTGTAWQSGTEPPNNAWVGLYPARHYSRPVATQTLVSGRVDSSVDRSGRYLGVVHLGHASILSVADLKVVYDLPFGADLIRYFPRSDHVCLGDWFSLRCFQSHPPFNLVAEYNGKNRVQTMAPAHASLNVYVGTEDGILDKLDMNRGVLVGSIKVHTEMISSVAVSPSDSLIATGGWERCVRLWDAELRVHDTVPLWACPNSLLFASENELIIGLETGHLVSWNISRRRANWTRWPHWDQVRSLALCPEKEVIYSIGRQGLVKATPWR